MKKEYLDKIKEYAGDILETPNFQSQKGFIQHGTTSVLEHVLSVAVAALALARKLHVKVNERALVRGALLHDYFLYDWHKKEDAVPMHGFHHAARALLNAERDFSLNEIEKDVIKKHMFPLNVAPPRYKESWLVCLADKGVSLKETFHRKKKK